MKPRYVDAHCHVDLYPDPTAIIEQAEVSETAVIAVTNTPSVFRQMVALASGSRFVFPALGLHPELAIERASELRIFAEEVGAARFVGEIGLDGKSSARQVRQEQARVFSEILEACSRSRGRILTVHSRRAADETIQMIGPNFPGKVILHWFTGSMRAAEKALTNGFYFSVNHPMVSTKGGKALLKMLPRDRVLTESDGPLLRTPKGPATPQDMPVVVRELASIWGITSRAAQSQIAASSAMLFRD